MSTPESLPEINRRLSAEGESFQHPLDELAERTPDFRGITRSRRDFLKLFALVVSLPIARKLDRLVSSLPPSSEKNLAQEREIIIGEAQRIFVDQDINRDAQIVSLAGLAGNRFAVFTTDRDYYAHGESFLPQGISGKFCKLIDDTGSFEVGSEIAAIERPQEEEAYYAPSAVFAPNYGNLALVSGHAYKNEEGEVVEEVVFKKVDPWGRGVYPEVVLSREETRSGYPSITYAEETQLATGVWMIKEGDVYKIEGARIFWGTSQIVGERFEIPIDGSSSALFPRAISLSGGRTLVAFLKVEGASQTPSLQELHQVSEGWGEVEEGIGPPPKMIRGSLQKLFGLKQGDVSVQAVVLNSENGVETNLGEVLPHSALGRHGRPTLAVDGDKLIIGATVESGGGEEVVVKQIDLNTGEAAEINLGRGFDPRLTLLEDSRAFVSYTVTEEPHEWDISVAIIDFAKGEVFQTRVEEEDSQFASDVAVVGNQVVQAYESHQNWRETGGYDIFGRTIEVAPRVNPGPEPTPTPTPTPERPVLQTEIRPISKGTGYIWKTWRGIEDHLGTGNVIYSGLEKHGATQKQEWNGFMSFDPSIIPPEATIEKAEVELTGAEYDQHLHKDNKDLPGSWTLRLLSLPEEIQAEVMETDELDPRTLWKLIWTEGREIGSLSLADVGPGIVNTFKFQDELLPVLQEALEKGEKLFFRLDYEGNPHLKRVAAWETPRLEVTWRR